MEGSKASLERISRGRASEDKRQGSSVDLSSSSSDDSRRRTCHVRYVTSKDVQLESTKTEMGEVKKENERLRMHLDRMIKEYQELQKQFQKAKTKENENINQSSTKNQVTTDGDDPHEEREEEEEDQLVLLSLGRTSSIEIKHQGIISKGKLGNNEKDGLGLGLGDYNYNHNQKLFDSSKSEDAPVKVLPLPGLENISSSAEDTAKEDSDVGGSSWPPQKVLKRREFENSEPSHPSNGKRARVCLRIRCETPTMNDGCQWRKYGQKIAKGNPCPRAYYRCTVAPACPVRKQVQRCAEDMSILIITYEGTHNHPLPISATSMASTTSAATSMLLSGPTNSNTSRPSTTSLNGLSYYAPNAFSNKPNNIIQPLYQLPTRNSSSNPSPNPNVPNHQTITLDLTSQNNNTSSIPSHNPHFGLFPRSNPTSQFSSCPTSLSFSSSPSQLGNSSNNNRYCYSSVQANTTSSSSNQFATSSLDHKSFYQPKMQRNNNNNNVSNGDIKTDSSTTMTAAIISDPSFQSALAAAISTIIGSSDSGQLQGMMSGLQPGNLMNHGRGNNLTLRQPTQAAVVVPKCTSTSPGVSIKEDSI